MNAMVLVISGSMDAGKTTVLVLVVCRLLAQSETMEHCIRLREPGMQQEDLVGRSRSVEAVLSAAQVEDFTTLNDGRDVSEVAREVLRRAGWIP